MINRRLRPRRLTRLRAARRWLLVPAALAASWLLVLVLWAAPAGAFSATSSPCDLIRSNLETVLGLPQVWERPVIGPHGKSAPDVTSTCKIEAWDASKPTSKKELDERIVRGSAAAGYVRTWVASPRSPDVAKWRDTLFRRTLDHAVAGCATLGKDPDGAKLRLPLDGAQSAVGYQGVNVGLDACGVWDRGTPHPSTRTTAGRSPSGRTDLGNYRIITIQLQQSPQKPVADDLTGIARYLVGGFWHTNALPLLHLYWTNDAGTISTANADGSNPHVIVTTKNPNYIAVGGNQVYWTAPQNSAIWEANLDGSNAHKIHDDYIGGVAASSAHLYWTDDAGVWEANLDGSDPHTIFTQGGDLRLIAVNASHLYVDEVSPPIGIWEAKLDGSDAHMLDNDPVVAYPEAMAVNNSHLYWWNPPCCDRDGEIWEANLDGSNARMIMATRSDLDWGLAADSSAIYGTDLHRGTVWQANPDGSGQHHIITGQNGPYGIAVGPGAVG